MPLGTNYDWGGLMGGYEDALSQLYQGQQTDFLDFLRSFAPQLMQFLQQRKLEKLTQQQRVGGILEAGEGAVLPQDVNMLGQAAPEMMPWEQLRSLVGSEPSPFPAGPMSVSKEAQRDLPPLFARSPENQAMRQFQLQRAMNLAYPQPEEEKETDIYGKLPGWMRHATPEQKEAYIQKQIAVGAKGEKQQPQYLWSYEKFKQGYKLENPEATEKETEKAFHQYEFGKKEKAYITAPQMMNKFYSPNMFGMAVTWEIDQKLDNITAQEKIAVMSGDEAQLKEMDAVRVAEGFPTRKQEQELLGVIATLVQQGDKREQIEAGLKKMNYSNDYIRYLLRLAGVR